MEIGVNSTVSIKEANQNFSKVAQVAEEVGEAIILKDDKPKFVLIDIESNPYINLSDDEKIDIVATRIMKRFRPALEELAK